MPTPALLEKALALCIEQGHLRRHAVRNQPSTLMRINFAATQEAGFWKVFGRRRAALGK